MSYVIKVENVFKKYQINSSGANFPVLRDKAINFFQKSPSIFNKKEEFWALKDINFEVMPGEVLGVIGANGSGKSTLLKILSRITPPTKGSLKINGSLASLLEIGTGFHPELTGRDNIFLNGAILGMRKEEIERKFDEIVEFSGIEKFIDTPVKFYSSGMSVRLAFSIAASLDPEILLFDEVLSVGDNDFQRKSSDKMKEIVKDSNRTIVFVSHNMKQVKNLCNRCILLRSGEISMIGNTNDVIDEYLYSGSNLRVNSVDRFDEVISGLSKDSVFNLKSIRIFQNEFLVKESVLSDQPLTVELAFEVFKNITGLRLFVSLFDDDENILFRTYHDDDESEISEFERGIYRSVVEIPANLLGPKSYKICINANIYNLRNVLPTGGICASINVKHLYVGNDSYQNNLLQGSIFPIIKWKTKRM